MDQPRTLQQAIRYFSDEQVCIDTVAKLRWPNGPVCVACGHTKHYYLKTQKRWKCRDCHKQFSVKLGTIFEDSPIRLDKWLVALWMLVNCRNGVSSYANMGNYELANAEFLAGETTTPDIVATRRQGRHKYGFELNFEQEITPAVGVFGRVGWSDGRNESFAYTEDDRTIELGAFAPGRILASQIRSRRRRIRRQRHRSRASAISGSRRFGVYSR